MTDSGKPNLDDRIDRYVRRELSPEEARALAQESLDSPELFEELTYSALAGTAVSASPAPNAKVHRFPRKAWLVAAATVAAAVVLVSLYAVRPHPLRLQPALADSSNAGQPVLLASGLRPAPVGREGAPVFRNPEPGSRAPRPGGLIVSIENGEALVNLGSLDGLAKGSELQIVRDNRPTGRLTVTSVFRESARGRIAANQPVQVHEQVRIADSVHLEALLEEAEALVARGDGDAAREMAKTAADWAETTALSPAQKGKGLERLAELEYRAGWLQAAETHLRSAAESLPLGGQPAAWNDLAVLQMLRGDYEGAEAPLRRAISLSSKSDIAYARSTNNLGVLAETRGDRRKAEALYVDALRALAGVADVPARERQVIETNLARSQGAH